MKAEYTAYNSPSSNSKSCFGKPVIIFDKQPLSEVNRLPVGQRGQLWRKKEIAHPALVCCILSLFAGRMALPENFAKKASFALPNTESRYLGEVFGQKLMDHADQSGILLLSDGKQIVLENEPYAGFWSKSRCG